ncbi:MAG: glycosyltransferase, partial [Patescibacteria group bacterium]
MISGDRNSFLAGSSIQSRFSDYGKICKELHIIVFTGRGYNNLTLSGNVFLYPTNSFSRWLYIIDAVFLAKKIPQLDLVTTQDPFESGLAGWIVSMVSGAKLHFQIHTDFLSPYFTKGNFLNRIRIVLARFLLPRADGIRVVSERIKNSLKTKKYKLKTIPVVLPIFTDAKKIMETIPKFDIHKKYPQFDFIIL